MFKYYHNDGWPIRRTSGHEDTAGRHFRHRMHVQCYKIFHKLSNMLRFNNNNIEYRAINPGVLILNIIHCYWIGKNSLAYIYSTRMSMTNSSNSHTRTNKEIFKCDY